MSAAQAAGPTPNPTWLDEILDGLAVNPRVSGDVRDKILVNQAKQQILQTIDAAIKEAETTMGEAVIERMEQSNYQWEKVESLIQSYQTQKVENVHNLKALKTVRDKS